MSVCYLENFLCVVTQSSPTLYSYMVCDPGLLSHGDSQAEYQSGLTCPLPGSSTQGYVKQVLPVFTGDSLILATSSSDKMILGYTECSSLSILFTATLLFFPRFLCRSSFYSYKQSRMHKFFLKGKKKHTHTKGTFIWNSS